MNVFRLATTVLAVVWAMTSVAQTEEKFDWMRNGRPECFHEETNAYGMRAPRKVGSQATAPLKASGVQHVPVVLVAFSDKSFSAADGTDEGVNAFYQKFCNGTMDGVRYTAHGSYGSIRDYFVEQSHGIFLPEFTIIGPVTLEKTCSYYGTNSGTTKDTKYSEFRNDAIKKAMDVYSDWEKFDNDKNTTIDMVFFIFAGLGESNTGGLYPNLIWPKEHTSSTTINERVFATSAATCECRPIWNATGTAITATRTDGVGVFCHELSHALGLPDFYDYGNKEFGMDIWSVMDYGEYCYNGYSPVNYTAYERDFMGWETLTELTEPSMVTIPCFAKGGGGYKITNNANPSEYYVLENRQAAGWDNMLGKYYGHGLQVTRVTHNATLWSNNKVNTYNATYNKNTYQHMTIIAANNSYKGTNSASSSDEWFLTLGGNLFPGTSYNYNLTDETTPAATIYTGGLIHKPIRNITENEDGTITLCFMTNGKLDTPNVEDAENVTMESFDASWATVENATKYVFELSCEDGVLHTDTLSENAAHYDDLQSSYNYHFRVKAIADFPEDYLDSEWSDVIEFQTLVDKVSAMSSKDQMVDVYTASGIRICRCKLNEVSRISIHRGIYILRMSDGTARRVFL